MDTLIERKNLKMLIHEQEKEEKDNIYVDIHVELYRDNKKIFEGMRKKISKNIYLKNLIKEIISLFILETHVDVYEVLEIFSEVYVWEKEEKAILFKQYKKDYAMDIYMGKTCLRLKNPYRIEIGIIDIIDNGLFETLFKMGENKSLWEMGEWALLYKRKMICPKIPVINGVYYKLTSQCLETICNENFLKYLPDESKFFILTREQAGKIAKNKVLRKDCNILLSKVNLDRTVEMLSD